MSPKSVKKICLGFFLILLGLNAATRTWPVWADDLEDLENELKKTSTQIENTEDKKESTQAKLEEARIREERLEGSITYYQFQIDVAQRQLSELNQGIEEKGTAIENKIQSIKERKDNLSQEKERLYEQIRILYKNSFVEPLEIYLRNEETLEGARMAILHQSVIENLHHKIYLLNQRISSLNEEKSGLETELADLQREKQSLIDTKKEVEGSMATAEKKVLAARSEQQQLMQQLTGIKHRLQELTRKEQEILALKAAAALASTSVGEIELSRKAISSAPPPDGNIYFSFWSYGYPHRVGMNQYGAYGRSKAGQDFQQILQAYYKGVKIEKKDPPETIKILEGGKVKEIPFEDNYLLGIGEMPSCWGKDANGGLEALKAQAVAARTYALNYTHGGQEPICTDQKCQVYVGPSKTSKVCGEYWEEAVRQTRGVVITYNGELISSWYASTAGGYTLSAREVWGGEVPYAQGTKDADAEGNYYDGPKWGSSPWFHKSWGDQPWLSKDQVEDLLNASLLPESYNAHLPEADKGGYSPQEIIETLQQEGINPITDLTSIEVIGEETKETLLLRVYSQGNYRDIDAQRFRLVFNLRSPGTDAIWSSRFDLKTN